jgi:hypothetical protein
MSSPILSTADSEVSSLSRDLCLGRSNSIDDALEPSLANPKIKAKLERKSQLTKPLDLLSGAKLKAQEIGFLCISTECESRNSVLMFRCPNNHKVKSTDFFHNDQPLSCKKCQKKLSECVSYAKAHNGIFHVSKTDIGRVLNEKFAEEIEFECEKKHIWKIKYSS